MSKGQARVRNRMTKFAKIFVDYYSEDITKAAEYALGALAEDDIKEAAQYVEQEFRTRGYEMEENTEEEETGE